MLQNLNSEAVVWEKPYKIPKVRIIYNYKQIKIHQNN